MPEPIYSAALANELCQGDVFIDVEIRETLAGVTRTSTRVVVLLSHDCEIDKRAETLLGCVARPISDVSAGDAGNIQAGRVVNAMHLPAVGALPESFIDFRFIYRLERGMIDRLAEQGNRVASMTENGRTALVAMMFRYFARRLPE